MTAAGAISSGSSAQYRQDVAASGITIPSSDSGKVKHLGEVSADLRRQVHELKEEQARQEAETGMIKRSLDQVTDELMATKEELDKSQDSLQKNV